MFDNNNFEAAAAAAAAQAAQKENNVAEAQAEKIVAGAQGGDAVLVVKNHDDLEEAMLVTAANDGIDEEGSVEQNQDGSQLANEDQPNAPEFSDAAAFTKEATEFAQIFQEIRKENLEKLEQMIQDSNGATLATDPVQRMYWDVENIVVNIDLLDTAYQNFKGDQAADVAYGALVALKNDLNLLKIEIQKGMDPVGLLGAITNEDLTGRIDSGVASGDIELEEAEKLKKRIDEVQSFAGMTLDEFVQWNEGSSFETFISFLLNPVDTMGKTGGALKFGTTEVNGQNIDNMPLPTFRELFSNHELVGKALLGSADQIDYGWAEANRSALDKIHANPDPKEIQKLLVDLYKKTLVESEKRNEKQVLFRKHFATALNGREKDVYMDDASFDYLSQQLKDGGKNLKSTWKISAEDAA